MIWYKFIRHNNAFMAIFFDASLSGNQVVDIMTSPSLSEIKQHIALMPRLAIHVRKFDWTN